MWKACGHGLINMHNARGQRQTQMQFFPYTHLDLDINYSCKYTFESFLRVWCDLFLNACPPWALGSLSPSLLILFPCSSWGYAHSLLLKWKIPAGVRGTRANIHLFSVTLHLSSPVSASSILCSFSCFFPSSGVSYICINARKIAIQLYVSLEVRIKEQNFCEKKKWF